MKKILFFIMLLTVGLTVATFESDAQSTSPRFGTATNRDNTYRGMTLGYQAITEAAGTDSSTLAPTKFMNYVYVTLAADSLYFKSPTITSCYRGDQLQIIASGASGTKLKFAGTNWQSAGTATLSSGLFAVINFVFSGAKWVEVSRTVQ